MNIPLPRRDARATIEIPTRGVLSQVVVVHPNALLRRGITGLLADSHICDPEKILSFETAVQAAVAMGKLSRGDVLILPVEEAAALEAPKGVAVGGIGGCDAGSQRLFEAGKVDALIGTSITPEELVRTVVLLASGGRAIPKRAPQQRLTGGLARLSQRQLEILELMTRGLLNKQIAWELGLTEGTVKSHVSAILEKLGCSRRTQAITAFMMSGARETDRIRAA